MKNVVKQLISFILPITVLIVVPIFIESDLKINFRLTSLIGLLIICFGLCLMAIAISTFIRIGKGTLAPWSPTSKLVIGGIYSFVRNPMIIGLEIVLIGESIFFFSLNILIWTVTFFILYNIFFILYEEPDLVKKFGDEYREYKRNVPQWIPKLNSYKPTTKDK